MSKRIINDVGHRPVSERRCRQGTSPVPASDLPVQLLDYVIGADTDPMLAGKIAVGQRSLNAVLDLLGNLLQLHDAQLNDHNLCLLVYAFFLSLA